MNRLRGLIAVFGLLFLLSGISLLLLVIDDKKDLSSRASTTEIKSGIKPLVSFSEATKDFPYNPNLWLKLEGNIYLNQQNGDTLRFFRDSLTSASLSAVLGKNFIGYKLIGVDQSPIDGWSIEKYSSTLFDQTKKTNLWKSKNFTFLEVGNIKNTIDQTTDFLSKIIKESDVLGASTPDDSAKLATLIRPSVAMVLNHYCAELKFFSAPSFPLSDKVYPYCLTSAGSGFFISSDGLLATNGHIVKNLPKSALYYGISSGKLDNLLSDFLNFYFSQINKRTYTPDEINQKVKEVHASKEVLYQVGGLIADMNQKNILKFQNEKNSFYLQVGNQGVEVTDDGVKESASVIKANLVAADYQEPNDQSGFTSSDVALLKAEKGSFPALALGGIDDAYVGSNLQVVGFPAAANSTSALLDNNAISEPTFTKGVVSAIKEAKGNQKKLIQTDAIINHGNSGGPALLLNGKVVGVATYGVTAEDGSGSYNFLRDIQDVKDLVNKQNLKLDQGEVFKLWDEGLKNYWLGYFKYAKEKFKKLKELYPVHPLVNKYLDSAESKIGTVEDLTPTFTHSQRSLFMYLAGVVMAISLISTVVTLFLIYSQNNKKEDIPQVPTF